MTDAGQDVAAGGLELGELIKQGSGEHSSSEEDGRQSWGTQDDCPEAAMRRCRPSIAALHAREQLAGSATTSKPEQFDIRQNPSSSSSCFPLRYLGRASRE